MKRKFYKSKSFFSISFEFNKPFKNIIDIIFFKGTSNKNIYNNICIREHQVVNKMIDLDGEVISVKELQEYEIIFNESIKKAILDLVFPIENSCKEKCYLYIYCKNERKFYDKYIKTINEELKLMQEKLQNK